MRLSDAELEELNRLLNRAIIQAHESRPQTMAAYSAAWSACYDEQREREGKPAIHRAAAIDVHNHYLGELPQCQAL